MNLGYIDYLNCYPFYHHMFTEKPLENVNIVSGYPEFLNKSMLDGRLDMSPISAAAYADLQDRAFVLPDFCLSSIGYVRSVVLQSKMPIEELDGKRVGLTSASKTSVGLLKVILEKYYGLSPQYKSVSPSPSFDDIDAALVIGNEAMLPARVPVPYIYDLGDLWLRKTGHPVVFAVFSLQRKAADQHRKEIRSVIDSFRISLAGLESGRDMLIKSAMKKYPDIFYNIDEYYRLLKFEFTDALKKALDFYFMETSSLGVLDRVNSISWWKDE